MKRFYILTVFICYFFTGVKAQGIPTGGPAIVGRISGTVIDSATKKPVEYASVSIYRSGGKAPITGVVTDDKGNFKLDNVKAGSYKIGFTFIGYPTKFVDPVTTTPAKPDFNMGTVYLTASAKLLNEVEVTAERSTIENRIDKIVFNAEKDVTSAGGNVSDILRKVPLVSVDMDGNVSVRGDQNIRVLINGKPSGAMAASVADALRAIPADQVKSVEVITSPSAKYDAEGSAGIINIITKQKNMSGVSGTISGGIGTRQNNGNANFNYNKNRLSLSINAGGNFTWPQTSITDLFQTLSPVSGTTTVNDNHSENTIKRYSTSNSATLNYDINNYNNISSTFRFNQGGFDLDGWSDNEQKRGIEPTVAYRGLTTSKTTFGGFDWSADYTRKFKKEGHEVIFSGQWSHSKINNDFLYRYSAINPNQSGLNKGINNEYTAQADYTLPVSKLLKFEAGGKGIFRRLSSDYNIYTDKLGGGIDANPADFTLDPLNSNDYEYNQSVYAGYGVLTFTLSDKYSILTGARYEHTAINGKPLGTPVPGLDPFSADYNTFIPSLTVQRKLSATSTLKLSYSKRIQRPSLQFLNPYINRSNVFAQTQGNPELQPEISQTVDLNFNTFIKSSVINFSVYYKHTGNLIEGFANPITEVFEGDTINGTRSIYQNIGENNSWGSSFFGSVSPFKPLTIRANINAYTYSPRISQNLFDDAVNTGTYVMVNAFLNAQYDLGKNFVAEAFVMYNTARRNIQGTNPAFSMYVLGVKKQFMNKRASLGFNTVQPFKEHLSFNQTVSSKTLQQTSKTRVPFRSFGITFSYSFGNVKFSNPQQKKKGINNDDLKQDEGGGGGMGGGGTRGGSR
ncbi:TonB-dependent receptor [Mucilaginibacter hurinus]|uniref:TonB-dependent receptor n=1 Tax=Mucilaginibacter hurinus TaxID=2201324 RepID=A0A367GJP4_9SPHI|nr:TonB-dependent receptor [Mucilaginibacter hurinus]RCH53694.1 TonB-dependent receptor [Mucilaginibacter hurinus]